MIQLNRNPLFNAVSLALSGSVIAATIVLPAYADEGVLEEVIVTATKRAESLQDIPLSVQVLSERMLDNLGVKGFEDFIQYMPTVSYTTNGPGYGTLYMRGIASGGDGVHSGSMPSVGFYLDEQPVTTINQILDIHIYDIARIETLSGPQGTLFGQGSQSGTVRIITNKPITDFYEASYDVYASTTKSGDPGYGVDGMVNLPLGDRAAVRLVAWHKKTGGYIDNVYSEIDYDNEGIVKNNADVVESNFNEAEVSGLRAQLKIDLNENWTLTPGLNYQTSDAQGQWWQNPKSVGELQVARFFPDWADEDWYQASLTLEGDIGDMNLVYAGAYLDRDLDTSYDYTSYSEYRSDYYAYYEYACYVYDPNGDCADPSQFVTGDENFNRMSHELRLQSGSDQRLRWITGLFYQKQEHRFDLQWIIPTLDPSLSVVPGTTAVWQTDQKRVDRDTALFGEMYFDVTENVTLIGGVRWFEYENSLYGFNGWQGYCIGYYENGKFVEDRDNGTLQAPCYDTGILDDVQKGDDIAFKGSVEWRVSDGKMVYATYSEGFRAGGVNRARVPGVPKYDPDWVYNHEIGWKTTWADGSLRFNGAAYLIDWDDFQYAFLDYTVSPLTIIQNAGKARTKGVEWDLNWAMTDDFTLTFAGSYNDAKLDQDFVRVDSENVGVVAAPKGTEMPYVPKLQLTAIGRYTVNVGELPMFGQFAVSYSDESWNNLESDNRFLIPSATVLNLTAGIEKEKWSLTLYANNVTDERLITDIINYDYYSWTGVVFSGFDYAEVVGRPRSFGIRWSQRF
ncbi:MAG: TonB-dependent receptor [Xanthomonadales bacterium]|nr:TonB-dependent receptor [Xanthomonadales bacterium]